ncbi:MAG: short-chain alcohol dehydrogenase [Elusimicrobia bacterium]|nr:MAG: short-chain alcohol dehydrogenase [Elusimicrobiota bacterium]
MKEVALAVALVTGASSGIGRAVAEEAATRGWRVVLADKDTKGAEEAAAEIRKRGGTALVVKADVSSDADRAALLAASTAAFGGVDLLVNNAGYGYLATTEHLSLDESRKMFEVNYFAMVDLSRRALALMKKPKGGTVMNVSSVLGLTTALPESAQYAATKHAVIGWARSAEREFKRAGVTLKIICPSGTKTKFFDHAVGPDVAAVKDQMGDAWEDFDNAPKVAKDILDGVAAPGLFVFPGKAKEILPAELVKLLTE